MLSLRQGIKDGLAIGLGYLSVSFSFGILAVDCGLNWWQAVLVSLMNLTSAGQVAAVGIMGAPMVSLTGGMLEMALSTLIINIRYSLMGISLSQKADETMTVPARLVTGFVITDEIFGVAVSREKVTRDYLLGLGILPIAGWSAGTLLGAVCGSILPAFVTASLSIGIYGMFVAIVLPASRKDRGTALVSAVAVILSVIMYYIPTLRENIGSGFSVIICAVIAALVGVFAVPDDEQHETEKAAEEARTNG